MKFHRGSVEGAYVIESEPHRDARGYFVRTWCGTEFAKNGVEFLPSQVNMGFSIHKGTLRGLHYQVAPALEAKLVRCTRGALFDVVADLRPESPTYLKWHGKILTPDNGLMLYVPESCAHGCLTLEDQTEFQYMASAAYAPNCAYGCRFDDPAIGIEWPEPVRVISERDRSWPLIADEGE